MKHCLAKLEAPTAVLLDDRRIFSALLDAAHRCKLTVLGSIKHEFHPQGLTAVVLLGESHIAVHTYPEKGALYVDVFTCGTIGPEKPVRQLAKLLGARVAYCKMVSRVK